MDFLVLVDKEMSAFQSNQRAAFLGSRQPAAEMLEVDFGGRPPQPSSQCGYCAGDFGNWNTKELCLRKGVCFLGLSFICLSIGITA